MKLTAWFNPLVFVQFCTLNISSSKSSSSAASTNTTNTISTDKRQVVSENGVGVTADNSAVNILDGGAIAGAFDFAKTSLSEMIALTVSRDKVSAAAAAAVTDTAIKSISQISQTATAAVDTATADAEKSTNTKNLLIVGAIAAAGLWSLK